MAVFNGADEVYLGINDFNARNNIDGFCLNNLKDAVDFAHVFDVKVLLAINILFSDEDLQAALDTVVEAYNMGVDAFIIQDIGLARLVFENYPEIEIHASTQMGLHNLEGVQAVQKFGFKRIVLARETPLEEIKRIKENCNVEIEYFAQGALCVSFSGNCYLSSYLCGASGNRGRCKQLCRLPYTFEKDGQPIKNGFLLSAKDFNMSGNLKELEAAGVDVLKIEGRARRPFYVAVATREYFNDLHGSGANQEKLKLAFNRGYTAGYFDGNGKIISEIQNHIGLEVGKVERVNYGKKFNEVFISSRRKLSPKSTFKIFDGEKEKTVLTAYDLVEIASGKYKLTTTQKVDAGDRVNLIVDAKLENEVLSQNQRRKVKVKLFAREGQKIRAKVVLNGGEIEVEGEVCETANKQPIKEKDLKDNFNKSELFEAKVEVETLGNVFMPKQKLNEFRRRVFYEIFSQLTEKHRHNLKKIKIVNIFQVCKFDDFQIVERQEESFENENIIYSPSVYEPDDIVAFQIKCKDQGKRAYLDTPNFALKADIEMLEDIISKTKISIVANNYYALAFDTQTVIGAGLNVYNKTAAQTFDRPIITAESELSNRVDFPYMTLRHCPMKSHLGANCENCPYCDSFIYRMDNGRRLRLKRKKLSTCTFYLTD